jgi:hypothetical protein
MTPKEKAKELVFKFRNTMEFSTPPRFSKQSALIAVEEILNAHLFDEDEKQYWQQVRTEIENL